ncbi:uncharacterized protein [Labrus bergylta]|uniref:uncharacterized protein isoform X4 n=1 Tax=Labrus bergylta TaxID=56723 RepID=UPI00331448AE
MAGRLLFVFFMYVFNGIQTEAGLPPKLTVNSAVIKETDSVTLNCQTPSSVSQCYYQTLSGETVKILSCLQTLTGSELLRMDHQSSSAEVKVKCFYTVQSGGRNVPSPHSDTVSISIQSETNPNKESLSTLKTSVSIVTSPADQGIVEKESRRTQRTPSLITTTGLPTSSSSASTIVRPLKKTSGWTVGTASNNDGPNFAHSTSVKPESGPTVSPPDTKELWNWTFVWVFAGCGSTVVITVIVNVILWKKRRAGIVEKESRRTQRTPSLITTTGLPTSSSSASTIVRPLKKTSGWTVGTASNNDGPNFAHSTSVKPESGPTVSPPDTKELWNWTFVWVFAGCGSTVVITVIVNVILWKKRRAGIVEKESRRTQRMPSLITTTAVFVPYLLYHL